jgi:hypothetical protein
MTLKKYVNRPTATRSLIHRRVDRLIDPTLPEWFAEEDADVGSILCPLNWIGGRYANDRVAVGASFRKIHHHRAATSIALRVGTQHAYRAFIRIGDRTFDLTTHPIVGTIYIFRNQLSVRNAHMPLTGDPTTSSA